MTGILLVGLVLRNDTAVIPQPFLAAGTVLLIRAKPEFPASSATTDRQE